MYNAHDVQQAMSHLHASSTTLREVYDKMENKKRTRSTLGRTLAIAAAITMLLSVAALAAYSGFLAQLQTDEVVMPTTQEEAITVSTVGYSDSNEFKAADEWNRYLLDMYSSNTDDSSAETVVYTGHTTPPETDGALFQLGAYTLADGDKLTEIAEKYGLAVPSGCQINGFGVASDGPSVIFDTGSYYDNHVYDAIPYDLFVTVKGTFNRSHDNFVPADSFEQWEYTTKDGITVMLALGENKAIMAADMDGVFAFVNVRVGTENSAENSPAYGKKTIGRTDLEALADSMSFSAMDTPE